MTDKNIVKKDFFKNDNIIIISSIAWNMEYQGHHKLTFWWAKYAKKIIYIDNLPKRIPRLRELNRVFKRLNPKRDSIPGLKNHQTSLQKFDNIEIITPIILPSVNRFFNWINKKVYLKKLSEKIFKITKGEKPIVWCLLPTSSALNLINYLDPKILVYNCVDNYRAGRDAVKEIGKIEDYLVNKADFVAVTSEFLYFQKKSIRNDIYIIPPAVNYDLFRKSNTGIFTGIPERVCYFGGVNRQRINLDIIIDIAQAGFKVRIIGTVRDILPELSDNVEFIKAVEHEELPGCLRECDCLILPYNINEFTDGIMPAKMYECFATGKPIISTPIKNLKKFSDIIILAETGKDFVNALNNLHKLETEQKYSRRLEAAEKFSEEHQFDIFFEMIFNKLNKRGRDN